MSEETMENSTPKQEEEQQPNAESELTDEQLDKQIEEEVGKLKSYGENQKIRAEKAEKRLKELEAESAKRETPKEESSQSSEPDYAKLAFLKGEGYDHPDDRKLVTDESKRLKLPLTEVLGMEHMKNRIKLARDQRDAEAGMPDGTGKPSASAKNNVDYWMNKKNKDGSYATPPDPKLHQEVINKRMAKHSTKQMFDPLT